MWTENILIKILLQRFIFMMLKRKQNVLIFNSFMLVRLCVKETFICYNIALNPVKYFGKEVLEQVIKLI